jgi:hypothetical protein
MIHKLPKIIGIIVMIGGVLVIAGWILDVPFLKSISPQFVTMKFVSAVCFVLCGVALYLVQRIVHNGGEWESLSLLFIEFLVTLLMATLIISVFLGVVTGLESLFIKEAPGAIRTTVPGRPAVITMVDFMFIVFAGSLSLWKKRRSMFTTMHFLGAAVAVSGIVALAGYGMDIPALYYDINKISSAMALHTAILFVLLGAGFYALREDQGTKQ